MCWWITVCCTFEDGCLTFIDGRFNRRLQQRRSRDRLTRLTFNTFFSRRPYRSPGPGSPGSPRSPFTPVAPRGPIGPCFPGGRSGPGLPRVPGLPRRPRLPFGPDRQSVSSLVQTWFCSSRSSSLISSFTSATIWTDFCWEIVGDERFCLEMFSGSPCKHN